MSEGNAIQPTTKASTPASLHAIAAIAGVAAFYFASVILIPAVVAGFLYLLLDPIVTMLERQRVSRKITSPILILLFMSVIALLGYAGYGAFAKLAQDIPRYSGKVHSALQKFEGGAQKLQNDTQQMIPKTPANQDVQKVQVVEGFGGSWTRFFMRGIDSVFAIATSLFLIPMLTLFFLLDKERLGEALPRVLGPPYPMARVGTELTQMARGFFYGNLLVGLVSAGAFYAIFVGLKLENAVALALFAGFINLIPLVGAVLGALFPLAQAVLQFNSAGPLITILVSSISLHLLVANLIIPKVIGSRINVNATAATLGLMFWGWTWGAVGLLIAVPLTATLRILLAARPTTAAWAGLICENERGSLVRFRRKRTA